MLKKILLTLLATVLVAGFGAFLYYKIVIEVDPLISEEDRAELRLMPLPASLELKGGDFSIDPGFAVYYEGESNERLSRAINRFNKNLGQKVEQTFQGGGNGLSIQILGNSSSYPMLGSDESYDLTVSTKDIHLTAQTVYGAIHGLETLLQLERDGSIPTVTISDSPRFPWRGVMIDVSRHWIPKDVILRNIESMGAVKLNVLHLHLSDDQGFRLESKTYPLLHEKGSNGSYYTQEDMIEIIEYAADRGIRLVPEFDVPGHTNSWLIAYPELGSKEGPFYFGRKKGDDLFTAPLDPTSDLTYEFLDGFFGEMAVLFPDQYVHIGGDEVNPTAWQESEKIKSFMAENAIVDEHALQAYFNLRLHEIVKGHGKVMVGWEEIMHDEIGKDIVIQSWKNQKSLFQGVQSGVKGILSAGLYLDHKLHAGKHYAVDPIVLPGAIDIEPDSGHWKMYDITMKTPGSDMQSQLVIFDRNPENIFGFFAFLDQRNAFKDGHIANGKIYFEFNPGMGDLTFEADLLQDSIAGAVSLGLLSFDSNGKISGGNHLPGTAMPKIEIIRPLTKDEENSILGGEAAMWSEVVSDYTVESRVWPRSAAIAEKLWTPAVLTTDTEDMYRRLNFISNYLELRGSTHRSYQDSLISEIGGNASQQLKTLLDVMEEAKYYNRMTSLIEMEEVYLPELPLNTLADAALPESNQARRFNALVEEYKASPDPVVKAEIMEQLKQWGSAYKVMIPYFDESSRLKDIQRLSEKLAILSGMALQRVESGSTEDQISEIEGMLGYLETGENGLVVAVVPGLRLILQ